ncbi:MAG: topoisomerase C-terminal repeat-containing protein, partial [Pseudomonadota bacterium]
DDTDDEDGGRLPALNEGEAADLKKADASQHFTEPPPRYSEASLVKKMEELGIGRPSTYASVLSTLRDRDYVVMEKNRFHPEDKGRLVTIFLEKFFTKYVEYDFTADLEEKLDLVSDGKLEWKALLSEFWRDFHGHIDDVAELRVSEVLDTLNEILGPKIFPPKSDDDGQPANPRLCTMCNDGQLSLKLGRHGAFIGCSNYPECKYTRPFATNGDDAEATTPENKVLGVDPDTSLEVSLRNGRFGPYVQLGEEGKPKRSSIPKGWDAATLDLTQALKLLSLPREVGLHPEDSEPILANLGRYGPYVQHLKTYANLPDPNDVFDIGLNRAVALIAEKRANPGRRGAAQEPLKDLGKHPDSGEPVLVMKGRYGPYVKHQKTNATLPKDIAPEAVTLEQAVELITAKAGAPKKKTAKKAPTKRKAAAKKPATEKPVTTKS